MDDGESIAEFSFLSNNLEVCRLKNGCDGKFDKSSMFRIYNSAGSQQLTANT
jgi:hypothetical protein